MTAQEPKWKIYERIRGKIEESFGDCEVVVDHSVPGKLSGVPRQVDVWLERVIGDGHRLTVAVECRCYEERPVPIKDVDAFYGFLADVGANKGVIFSNTGFTSGATARADGDVCRSSANVGHCIDRS